MRTPKRAAPRPPDLPEDLRELQERLAERGITLTVAGGDAGPLPVPARGAMGASLSALVLEEREEQARRWEGR